MTSARKGSSAQKVYRRTLLGWMALMLIHLTIYLVTSLRSGPTDEVYANSISFQVIAFCLTVLPYWILALLAVLIAEFATVGRASKSES